MSKINDIVLLLQYYHFAPAQLNIGGSIMKTKRHTVHIHRHHQCQMIKINNSLNINMKIEVLLPTHIVAGACAQSLLLCLYIE